MSKPDQRLFEADLQSAAFRSGVLKRYWGLAEREALPADPLWPKSYFWIAASPRLNAPDRFYLVLNAEGYRSQAITGVFWDPERKEVLAFDRRPKGKPETRVAKVFRTDWESGRAFYHPYDRVAAHTHQNWAAEMTGVIWKPKHTIVDFLDLIHGLLQSGDYVGV